MAYVVPWQAGSIYKWLAKCQNSKTKVMKFGENTEVNFDYNGHVLENDKPKRHCSPYRVIPKKLWAIYPPYFQ